MDRLEHRLANGGNNIKKAQLMHYTHDLRPYEKTVSWLWGHLASLLDKNVVDAGSFKRMCEDQADGSGTYNNDLERFHSAL